MKVTLAGRIQAAILIPSKDRTGKRINQRKLADEIHSYFAKSFGGATELSGVGSWNGENGIVREKALEVSVFTSLRRKKIFAILKRIAGTVLKTANQESVGFRIGNDFYLVG